jgi:hypothetical protein
MNVSQYKISLTACFLLCGALAGTASAHDTWLMPARGAVGKATATGHRELTLELTTGSEFPALGTSTSPDRLLRANLISHDASVPLLMAKSTDTSLGLRGLTVANSVVMAVVQIKPNQVELAPENIAIYAKELGISTALTRRYQALGHWRESYTKNAKMWIRVGAQAAPASMLAPMNLPYELVPMRDPTRLKAGDKLAMCAYANGKARAKAYIGMIAADGQKTFAWTDAKGCASFKLSGTSGYLMHGIFISESKLPELDWESHFASFTVLDETRKASVARSDGLSATPGAPL